MIDMVLFLFFWVSLYSMRSAPISTTKIRHGSGEVERSHRCGSSISVRRGTAEILPSLLPLVQPAMILQS